MRTPQFERLAPFRQILRLVVDAGHAGEMAADVVDDRLNDVRLRKAELVEVRDEAPPQIVKAPCWHRLVDSCRAAGGGDPGVQFPFCFRPTRKPAVTAAEDKIATLPAAWKQRQGLIGQWYDVGSMVLRALSRQLDLSLVRVDLWPSQIPYL